jgi:geranylgeranyl reductase family protein
MDRCDVLIVGGGPAGSSCAWALRSAGLDVVVMDKAEFPRDKVCAGWITPAVIEALQLDTADYRRQHTFQPITGFRVGLLDRAMLETGYDHAVSFGIRRCEFDDYLLRRSAARLRLGEAVESLSRTAEGWVVNDAIKAPVIVGAAGHFCPVARFLGARVGRSEPAVHAQEVEFELDVSQQASCAVKAGVPELFFCADLKGYGWCVRKDDFLNIGLGREGSSNLSHHVSTFRDFLSRRQLAPADLTPRFQGHAYLLYPHSKRKLVDTGVLLIGDAAGLAYSQSGEGIRPAIESGLLAARTLRDAAGDYSREALASYTEQLQRRLGPRPARDRSAWLPAAVKARLAGRLLTRRWFVRRVVLERWFLHRHQPPLELR